MAQARNTQKRAAFTTAQQTQVQHTEEQEPIQMEGTVLSKASKVMVKESGATYVLHTVLVTDGPLEGKKVTAQRTLVNRDQVEKEGVDVDDEITLYCTIVQEEGQKPKPFFEIGSEFIAPDSDEELLGLLGL